MDEEYEEILVSAAASLTEALASVGVAWEKMEKARPKRRGRARFNFGASGVLAQQIRAGAPADVFASASPVDMDKLAQAKRIEPTTRRDFATNRLVLIASLRARAPKIKTWADLLQPSVRRVAVSSPDTVPAGRYARETLVARKLWTPLQTRFVFGEDVRQTLAYVASGDADAGFVFRTDARQDKRVRVVAEAVPGRDHRPIRYPVAVVAGCPHPEPARRFAAFLASPQAAKILAECGFGR